MSESAIRSAGARAILLCLVVLAPACSTLQSRPRAAAPAPGKLITAAQIERTGARTAWEALRRSHVQLSFFENGAGEPHRLAQRGTFQQAPLIVIDGLPAADGFRQLSQLPAEVILSIRVLSGSTATPLYGTAGGGGAILFETRKGPHR